MSMSSCGRATPVNASMLQPPMIHHGRSNPSMNSAMLVGSSIYQACKFYELFCQAGFNGKCAIVTSYEPQAGDIAKEDAGEGATERLRQYEIYRQMLADHFNEPADQAINKDDDGAPVIDDAVLVRLGAVPPEGPTVSVPGELYHTQSDTSPVEYKVMETPDGWVVTSAP